MPKQSSKREQTNIMANCLFDTNITNKPDSQFQAMIIRILLMLEEGIKYTRESTTPKIKQLKPIKPNEKCNNKDSKLTGFMEHNNGRKGGMIKRHRQ